MFLRWRGQASAWLLAPGTVWWRSPIMLMTGTSIAQVCATEAVSLRAFHLSNLPPLELKRNPSGQFHQLYFTHGVRKRRQGSAAGLATALQRSRPLDAGESGIQSWTGDRAAANQRERDL